MISPPQPPSRPEGGDEDDDNVRVLRPRRAAPADAIRPTRAEINLGHLRHNLRVMERAVGRTARASSPGVPEIWGVLKADAYGHGAPAVARTLERAGIGGLCVALLEEGLELRAAGITVPILVMGGYYGPHHRGLEEALEGRLTPVLYHAEQIEALARLARDRDAGPLAFHLKFDTGMARLGASRHAADELLGLVSHTRGVAMTGLMSHLACADSSDAEPTLAQLRLFESIVRAAKARDLAPRHCHVANSAGAIAFAASRFDAVRPGIALYGVSPFEAPPTEQIEPIASDLRPVMRVRSEIVALRTVADGERVGYGHTWRAEGERRIATIPMGYADGLSRGLSNRGHVVVRGRRAPIVGIVSMDLTTVDVTDIQGAALGDEVVLLGTQDGPLGSAQVTSEEIAKLLGTIPWEVVTSISRRVPRFYREP